MKRKRKELVLMEGQPPLKDLTQKRIEMAKMKETERDYHREKLKLKNESRQTHAIRKLESFTNFHSHCARHKQHSNSIFQGFRRKKTFC